jgi:hypothetical protein
LSQPLRNLAVLLGEPAVASRAFPIFFRPTVVWGYCLIRFCHALMCHRRPLKAVSRRSLTVACFSPQRLGSLSSLQSFFGDPPMWVTFGLLVGFSVGHERVLTSHAVLTLLARLKPGR